jgi:hypothetical protein
LGCVHIKWVITTGRIERARWGNVPIFESHEVEDVDTRRNEENLHKCVVERDKMEGEQVDIAGQEYNNIERLRLERDTCNKQAKLSI